MNPTGIEPVGYGVLIEVDEVETKLPSGIIIPPVAIEREQLGCDSGTLIAANAMAFAEWGGTIPEVGDKIIFEKYAGTLVHQRNVEQKFMGKYRICAAQKIFAVIKEKKDG